MIDKIRERLQKKIDYYNEQYESIINRGILSGRAKARFKASAYKEAVDIVNQVEAEYDGGWIPCSERLPEVGQCVVVQTKDFFDYEDETPIQIRMFDTQHEGYNWKEIGAGEWLANSCIVAWQPLPDPYIQKGE